MRIGLYRKVTIQDLENENYKVRTFNSILLALSIIFHKDNYDTIAIYCKNKWSIT
jgi:hypothetical protein